MAYYAFEHTLGFKMETTETCGEYPNGRPRTRDFAVGELHRFETTEGRDAYVEHVNSNSALRSKAEPILNGKFPIGWKRAGAVDNTFWDMTAVEPVKAPEDRITVKGQTYPLLRKGEKVAVFNDGDRYCFLSLDTEEILHSLAVDCTGDARLEAHWQGFAGA